MSDKREIIHKQAGLVALIRARLLTALIIAAAFVAGIILARILPDSGLLSTILIALLFVIIVAMIRENIAVEWALFTGSLVVGFFFRLQPVSFVREVFYGATDTMALLILGIVFFITVLGTFMDRSGHMRKMMTSLSELLRDARYVAGIAPAIIGLMPMPGGALFSAPMVESVGQPLGWSRERMAVINFWWRHVWEYVWPMYAGILLTSSILGVNIPKVILVQSPLTVVAILVGLVFLLLPLNKPPLNGVLNSVEHNLGEIWHAIWPVITVIAITLAPFPSPEAVAMDSQILTTSKLLISLILSTFAFAWINNIKGEQILQDLKTCLKKHTIAIVLSIMVFKHLIEHSEAAIQMAPFFTELGLPPIMLVFLLTFIVGLLTGITMAYVGICYPIIAPLMMTANGEVDFSLMQFAYASGFVGVMLTPVHLCFTLTREYFQVEWSDCYRLLLAPSLVLLAVSFAIALIF